MLTDKMVADVAVDFGETLERISKIIELRQASDAQKVKWIREEISALIRRKSMTDILEDAE